MVDQTGNVHDQGAVSAGPSVRAPRLDPARMTREADPLRVRVGESYDSGVQRWPGGPELILTTDGCVLLVDYISPTPEQIDEFETADTHFAWVDARYNGILCYRFGASPWKCIPFNPHRDTPPGKGPGMPALAPGQHLPVTVGLADSDSPVLATRIVKWPEYFVSAVGALAVGRTRHARARGQRDVVACVRRRAYTGL